MCFGLCNAPQSLCALIDEVIPHYLRDRILVYLDDLLIASSTFDEHLELLTEVASRLKTAGLTINVDKSKFLLRQINYLGYVIGEGCLRVNSDRIEAIVQFPIPKSVRQVRRFLGVTGWYQRFIASYSTLASPITDLLKGGKKFKWSVEAQEAFDKLKTALVTAPVLRNPDFNKRFFLQVDASSTGVGCVLFQKNSEGGENPIAFMSKKLNGAQRNYSVTEQECLAAILAVKKFRAYIEGMPFTIITDHASLQWLMKQKDLSGRLARWSLKLQAFDFEVEYLKGSLNVVPDALSRMHSDEIVRDFSLAEISDLESSPLHIDLKSDAFLDSEYVSLVDRVMEEKNSNLNLRVVDGKIFINPSTGLSYSATEFTNWKLVVPQSLTQNLIVMSHNPPSASHQGSAKTLEILKRQFFWKNMTKDVQDFVSNCDICRANKAVNFCTKPPMGEAFEASRPWQHIYCDFLGPYPRSKKGNTCLLIVLDHYSRFVLLKPLRQATAENLCKFLEKEVFCMFSVPEVFLSDNGRQFESKLLLQLLEKLWCETHIDP